MTCSDVFSSSGIRCVTNPQPVTANSNEVLIGAVPFRALGLSEKNIYDQFNSKFTYAVTRDLTDTTKFDNAKGAIGILNQDGDPYNDNDIDVAVKDQNRTRDTSNKYKVLYAIISHGADLKGAYQRNGIVNACNDPGLDKANCNSATTTGMFRALDRKIVDETASGPSVTYKKDAAGVFYTSPTKGYSLAPGIKFYDDMITYRTTTYDKAWSGLRDDNNSAEAAFTSESLKTAIRSPGSTDEPETTLEVSGDVQAFRSMTETICGKPDASGQPRCFRTKNITGPPYSGPTGLGSKDAALGCSDKPLTKVEARIDGNTEGISDPVQKRSAGYLSRNCDDIPKVVTSGAQANPIAAINCPTGFSGWRVVKVGGKEVGKPICPVR